MLVALLIFTSVLIKYIKLSINISRTCKCILPGPNMFQETLLSAAMVWRHLERSTRLLNDLKKKMRNVLIFSDEEIECILS